MSGFYVAIKDLNSGPQAFIGNTLSIEPASQPLRILLLVVVVMVVIWWWWVFFFLSFLKIVVSKSQCTS